MRGGGGGDTQCWDVHLGGRGGGSNSHLAVTEYPPRGDRCPSTASKPADTNTTSGANSRAMGITTVLGGHSGSGTPPSPYRTPPPCPPPPPHLKAVRYSTSPMGGSTPPVHAMLML